MAKGGKRAPKRSQGKPAGTRTGNNTGTNSRTNEGTSAGRGPAEDSPKASPAGREAAVDNESAAGETATEIASDATPETAAPGAAAGATNGGAPEATTLAGATATGGVPPNMANQPGSQPTGQPNILGGGIGGVPGGAMGGGVLGQSPIMNPQQQVAVNEAVERVGMFGQVVWLLMQSPAHKHLFLNDMEWLVLPAIQANQFRVWQQNGMPIVYASWAWLDQDAEARMKANIKKLAPMDWPKATAGDSDESLWLIDLIAPFGGMEEAIKDLKENVFQGQSVKMLQPGPGGGMATVEW